MARYGAQFGPDLTFLGVDPRRTSMIRRTYADADVVIVGAPFDGGTSYRSGARFGPQGMRETCYLGHDGSRPSLALRVDGLQDLRVVDVGDVEMFSGDAARSCRDLEAVVEKVAATGAIPLILGGDHTVTWPDVTGVARGHGQLGPRRDLHFDAHADTGEHRVRFTDRSRPAHAPTHRIRRGARRPFPADRAAGLLAAAGHPGLDGRAADAFVRDDRDRHAGSRRSA